MKKRYVLPIIGAAATIGVSYLMKNRENSSSDSESSTTDTFVQAGIPDQVNKEDRTQLENAKMVSEGSQFGVQYFNKTAQEEIENLSKEFNE
ncbi:hypothetical protein SPD48_13725 [Pseudogracilibacillus sp. SE30717A]|uniref:hypothetical protein n=1 Tax=Pseudogracilibacillus sp. SE30717A TaxID=3098293 RepID=UPI00300DF775